MGRQRPEEQVRLMNQPAAAIRPRLRTFPHETAAPAPQCPEDIEHLGPQAGEETDAPVLLRLPDLGATPATPAAWPSVVQQWIERLQWPARYLVMAGGMTLLFLAALLLRGCESGTVAKKNPAPQTPQPSASKPAGSLAQRPVLASGEPAADPPTFQVDAGLLDSGSGPSIPPAATIDSDAAGKKQPSASAVAGSRGLYPTTPYEAVPIAEVYAGGPRSSDRVAAHSSPWPRPAEGQRVADRAGLPPTNPTLSTPMGQAPGQPPAARFEGTIGQPPASGFTDERNRPGLY
jgi:hypothetical protein